MDRDVDVCDKCYRNCLLFHQTQHDHSPDSFFKIMFGKKFSEVLVTPPRFSRTHSPLAGKKIFLEDHRGQKWEVYMSDVNGTLAIQKGWNKFCIDHNIRMGELLVFHYITESHFMVLIWGTSGCLRTFPTKECTENKRSKTTMNSSTNRSYDEYHVVSSPPRVSVNVESKENNINGSHAVPDVYQEPCFFSNSKPCVAKEDDREHILDLFALEHGESKSDIFPSKMIHKNLDAKKDNGEYIFNSAVKINEDHPSDVINSMMSEQKVQAKHTEPKLQGQGTPAVPQNISAMKSSKPLRSSPRFCSPRVGPVDTPMYPKISMGSVKRSNTKPSAAVSYSQPSGETARIIKQETRGFKEDLFDGEIGHASLSSNLLEKAKSNCGVGVNLNPVEVDVKIKNIVKSEPVDFCDSAPEPAPAPFIRVTCVVPPDNETFLELPEPLPMKGRKNKLFQTLIILRNQAGKDWPVMYHFKYRFKVLTSGWATFIKANDIRPGDQCGFVVDDIEKCIFRVCILNR